MATVSFDPTTGSATVSLAKPVAKGRVLQLSLRNLSTDLYLTAGGWVNSRRHLVETTSTTGELEFIIDPAIAARIDDASNLLIEDVKSNFRESLAWVSPPLRSQPEPVRNTDNVSATVGVEGSFHTWKKVDDSGAGSEDDTPDGNDEHKTPTRSHVWLAAGAGIAFGALLMHLLTNVEYDTGQTVQATHVVKAKNDTVAASGLGSAKITYLEEQIRILRSQLASTTTNSGGAESIDAQMTALRVDRGQLAARVAEQERLIVRLRDEIAGQTGGSTREANSLRIDLATAKRDIVTLTEENMALKVQIEEATIAVSTEPDEHVEDDPDSMMGILRGPRWVSVAYSQRGHVILSAGFRTAEEARRDAQSQCLKFAKGAGCKEVETEVAQCVALARQHPGSIREGWRTGMGDTERVARRQAMESCTGKYGNCTMSAAKCF